MEMMLPEDGVVWPVVSQDWTPLKIHLPLLFWRLMQLRLFPSSLHKMQN